MKGDRNAMDHQNKKNTAVVTVIGRDHTGIIAAVSAVLTEQNANIQDIAQTVLTDVFNMVMLVDVSKADFGVLADALRALQERIGVQILIQRSEIFDAMHHI